MGFFSKSDDDIESWGNHGYDPESFGMSVSEQNKKAQIRDQIKEKVSHEADHQGLPYKNCSFGCEKEAVQNGEYRMSSVKEAQTVFTVIGCIIGFIVLCFMIAFPAFLSLVAAIIFLYKTKNYQENEMKPLLKSFRVFVLIGLFISVCKLAILFIFW